MPHFTWSRSSVSAVASLIVSAGVLLSLSSRATNAQGQGGPQADADGMFRQFDVNKDGKLTKAEVGPNAKNMIDYIFRMAEKPDNGSLTREEFQVVFDKHRAANGGGGGNAGGPPPRDPNGPPPPRPNDGGFPPILRMLDGNNDQRLTRTELNRISQLFDRLDTNKDGALDAAEVEAAGRPEGNGPAGGGPGRPNNRPPAGGAASNDPPRDSAERSSSGSSNATAGPGDASPSRIAGVWRGWVVRGRGENPNEGEMELEITVEGNRMSARELGTRRAPEGLGAGTFTMTGAGRTGNLDADGTSGAQDGRHSMGIYELDGDTLKWCVTQRNRQRPATMASDRGNFLLILRKQSARN